MEVPFSSEEAFLALQPVWEFFSFPAVAFHEILSGNVNRTYHVVAANGDACIAQRLNPVAFRDPSALMRNGLQVLAHMRAAMEMEGKSCDRRLMEFLPGRDGYCLFVWICSVSLTDRLCRLPRSV